MTYLLKHTSIEEHEIPEIQLYMDQVLEFFEQNLSPLKRSADDPIFTKTMINNYVKAKVIDAPLKKSIPKRLSKT